MRIHVLGSAAGGGFPQWNCGCFNCNGVRTGTIAASPRTQTSMAITAAGGHWFLIHASPDIRSQLSAFPPLHPRAPRDSPIAGIILTNGDLDQCLGLLSLRESQPLHLYATETVRRTFTEHNRLYRALSRMPGQITWHELKLGTSHPLSEEGERSSALVVTAISVRGKVPLYAEGQVESEAGENIALLIRDDETGLALGPPLAHERFRLTSPHGSRLPLSTARSGRGDFASTGLKPRRRAIGLGGSAAAFVRRSARLSADCDHIHKTNPIRGRFARAPRDRAASVGVAYDCRSPVDRGETRSYAHLLRPLKREGSARYHHRIPTCSA